MVGAAQSASIVAGGGGVAPTDEAWNITNFQVETLSGIIASVDDIGSSILEITPSDAAVYGTHHLNGKLVTLGYDNTSVEKRLFDNLTTIAGGEATQKFTFESLTSVSGLLEVSDTWTTGVDKTSRLIHAFENLPVDYTITNVIVTIQSTKDLSAASPAIMRFYQYPEEASAITMDIVGVGTYTRVLNFDITQSVASPRRLIIDLWDPSDDPNNVCSVRGSIVV